MVSVVVPTYNYSDYVAEAVQSVFAQTYRHIEIVGVDDGSSDDSLERLQELQAVSPFPMRVLGSGHRGVSGAMNVGLGDAQGDLISILHADDRYAPTKVEAQVALFMEDPAPVLVHCEYQAIDAGGAALAGIDSSLDPRPAQGDALRDILLLRADVRSMTMMYRRDVMVALGGYDEGLPSEDWQSILRLCRVGPIGHVPRRLVDRRVHQRNLSITLYRGEFSSTEAAPAVIAEVAPPDMDIESLIGRHIGTVVRNSLAECNIAKATAGLRVGWREHPRGRLALLKTAAPGLVSLAWTQLRRVLPPRAITWVRRLKYRILGVRSRWNGEGSAHT